MKQDVIEIEILEDGTIKTVTDKVSMPNHANAEGFMRQLATYCGGFVKRVRRIAVGASLLGALHEHTHDGHTHTH